MEDNKNTSLQLPDLPEASALQLAVSLLTPGLARQYEKIPQTYHEMHEDELRKLAHPTDTEEMLRISFWREVRNCAEKLGEVLSPINVYTGACTKEHFYNYIVSKPEKLALILRPPASYEMKANVILDRGTSRIMEALNAKVVYSNGHMDAKATKTVLDIVAYFDSRTKGAVKQKIEIDSKNQTTTVNVSVSAQKMTDLDHKLREVKEKLAQFEGQTLVQDLPERVKDVTETES